MTRPEWHREGRDWPHRQHSQFVSAGGLRWHVQVMGGGPPLLLLHGTGASGHSFRGLMPRLAERFTVISPDLPGHAFTSAPPSFRPALPTVAAALSALLGELRVAPVLGVGHSAGAALLVQMTLDRAIAPRALFGLAAALVPFRGVATSFFAPAARLLAHRREAQGVERIVGRRRRLGGEAVDPAVEVVQPPRLGEFHVDVRCEQSRARREAGLRRLAAERRRPPACQPCRST